MGVSLDPHDRWSTAPRIYWLWAGVLLPAAAWAAQLSVLYGMSAAVCAPPRAWPFYVVSLAALGLSGWGGRISFTLRQASSDEPEDAPDSMGRGRFMATGGMLLSAVFSLAILAQIIPILLLDPCHY